MKSIKSILGIIIIILFEFKNKKRKIIPSAKKPFTVLQCVVSKLGASNADIQWWAKTVS